jgi:predicted MFS family arabinose efflux permease
MRPPPFDEHFHAVAAVFRHPGLRRLELAWGGYYVGEWTQFVALSVYAFEHGGTIAVGLFGLTRMGAAAVALPFGGVLTDRYPRARVLFASYLLRAAALAATAVAIGADAPRAAIFALAALAAVGAAPIRPATMSVVPLLARTPQELVAANVSSSSLEGLGTLTGPLIGGLATAWAGPATAVALAAVVQCACAAAVLGVVGGGEPPVRAGVTRGLAAVVAGAKTLREDAGPRLIVLLAAAQTFVRGLLNVLLTVAALGVLGLGESGVGWLNGTLGAGAVVGSVATVGLVNRRRLAGMFALALVLWGSPIALIGIVPHATVAFAALAVVGLGNALLDVSGFTLLQRTVDDHVLGRVFGAFEILCAAGIAAGSGLGAVAVHELGVRTTFVAAGCILPSLALLTRRGLGRIDDTSRVPQPQLGLLAAVPLFAPLPVTTLERLAARSQWQEVEAGETVIAEGTTGESFYVVASGRVEVSRSGSRLRVLEPGDSFGEIALLRDTMRTATCRALTDLVLYELDRATFVAAVSGDLRSAAAADELVESRLAPAELPEG